MVEKSGFPLMAFILEVATGYDITILEEKEREKERREKRERERERERERGKSVICVMFV